MNIPKKFKTIEEYMQQYYLENKNRISKLAKQRYLKNKDKILQYRKQYYLKNKDKIKQYLFKNKDKIKQYLFKNKDKLRKQHKKYELKNKDKRKQQHKQWRLKNKNKYDEYQEQYKIKNRDKLKKDRLKNRDILRKYKIRRLKNNLNYRLRSRLSTRIYMAVKKYKKSKSTMQLVGCSLDYLKDYLESQFDDEMSWNNYGEWHIDHIIPCTSFDLSKPKQQQVCFHYSNLQPLWAIDNMSKGNRIMAVSY